MFVTFFFSCGHLDDITHPHEEKNSCLSNSTDDECISVSQEALVKSHLQALQHTGGRRLPKLFSEASVTKDQSAGIKLIMLCHLDDDKILLPSCLWFFMYKLS